MHQRIRLDGLSTERLYLRLKGLERSGDDVFSLRCDVRARIMEKLTDMRIGDKIMFLEPLTSRGYIATIINVVGVPKQHGGGAWAVEAKLDMPIVFPKVNEIIRFEFEKYTRDEDGVIYPINK